MVVYGRYWPGRACLRIAGSRFIRHHLVDERIGRTAYVHLGHGCRPGHGRNRHHAHWRDGKNYPAYVWCHRSLEYNHQFDDCHDYRRGSSSSADLLTDLKAGYLLGASPRWQTIAQLFGVLAGVLVCVPIYSIIVRTPPFDPNATAKQADSQMATAQPHAVDATMSDSAPAEKKETGLDTSKSNLLSDEFPAPAMALWMKVAQLLDKGIKNLPKGSVIGMIIGAALGILIALAEEFLPKSCVKWIPSATGLGIAGVIPAFNSISMFLGAFTAWVWLRIHRKSGRLYDFRGLGSDCRRIADRRVDKHLAGCAGHLARGLPILFH